MMKPGIFIRFLCNSSILLMIVTAVRADDWPRWRGPKGSGLSEEANWNGEALKNGPSIVWETNVGKGHSSFSVKGDFLLTTGNRMVPIGTDTVFEDIVFCLHARNGREIWRYAFPSPETDQFPGPQATPTIEGSSVFAAGRNGRLVCLDLRTGQVHWLRDLEVEGLTKLHPWGYSASPLVDGDRVILNAGQSGLALDKHTGSILWKSEPEVCGYASPVAFDCDGRRLAAIHSEKVLSVVEVEDGRVVWSFKWEGYNDPVILGERILLTGGRGGRNRGSMLIEWNGDEDKIIWNNRSADASFQNWVVLDGHAYGVFRDSRIQEFRCIDVANGQVVWTEDLGEWGSYMVADRRFIIATGSGELILADSSPQGFQVMSRARILSMPDTSRQHPTRQCYLWTQPVLANGLVYVRNTHGDLVCVDVSD